MPVPWPEHRPPGRSGWTLQALAVVGGLWLQAAAPTLGAAPPMPPHSGTNGTGTTLSFEGDPRCDPPIRPLNPAPPPSLHSFPAEQERATALAFANAYEQATAADWEAALRSYQQALEFSNCSCDRSHARAGQRAAREAWFVQRTTGPMGHPTQVFWSRLQYLTRALPCVRLR